MPRTFGRNQIHASQVEGWFTNERPLDVVSPPPMDPIDHTIASFVAGGGNLLVSGEHDGFPSWNSNVNALLAGIGSGMRIVPDQLDANALFVAQPQTTSHYLTGTTGFQFGATSRVSGGTGLFGTQTTNQTMLAVEGAIEPTPGVPEPASWALLISGFGLTGTALRRRRAAAA